tara:strand:+ start:3586 stop:4434 length:849 start_codon:yes stop_codon:yes gene_type:complete
MPLCNENTATSTPDEIFAAAAIPACGKFVNPGNLQCEQLVYNQAFSDLINNYGIPISYFINTFNTLSADMLYGQDPTQEFFGPIEMQMYIELSDDAVSLTKFGFDPGDEFTAFVHISSFTTSVSSKFDYASYNQSIEPKSGDLISLSALGCDRPNGRGEVVYQITERMDQDMAALNPALGHYVYRLRGKRFEYSFEDGLSARATYDTGALSNTDWPQSEPVNEQIFDSSFSGVVSSTLTDQTSSEGKTYRESGNDPYDIDTSSKKDVLDMSVNDTDIYGSYY